MAAIETIRRIRVQQVSEGGSALRADLEATGAAFTKAGEGAQALGVAVDVASKRQLSGAAAFDKARAQVDGVFAATKRYEQQINALNRGLNTGGKSAEEYAAAVEMARTRFDAAVASATKYEATLRSIAQATIKARQAQEDAAKAFQTGLNARLGVGGSGGGNGGGDRASDFQAAIEAGDRLRAKYDQIFAAGQKLAAIQSEVAQAVKIGVLSQDLAAEAVRKATLEYNGQVSTLERLARTQKEGVQKSVNSQTIVPDRAADIAAYGAELDRLRAKYDPLYRAQEAYRTGLAELRNTYAVGAIGQDAFSAELARQKAAFVDVVAGLGKVSQAQRDAAAAAAQATAAEKALTDATARAAQEAANKQRAQSMVDKQTIVPDRRADVAAAFAEADKERAALVPLVAAQNEYAAAVERADRARANGTITQEERNAAVGRASATLLNQTNEMRKAEEANARLTKGVGLNAYGWQNLGYQINDVVTSIGAGISPMQTFAQQGGQIYQVLQGGQGGVSGSLKAIGERGLGLARGLGIAGGVVAGLGVAFAVGAKAAMDYSAAQDVLNQRLSGIGRASGASAGQINAIAKENADAGNVSIATARDMAGQFAATGKIGVEMYGDLIKTGKDYAATTGQDLGGATKALAEAFADPAKGAETLNAQLGILNGTQLENIQRLAAQGNRLGAQKALFDAYNKGLTSATELTSGWGRVTAAVGKEISDIWTNLGEVIDNAVGGDLDRQIARATSILQASKTRQGYIGSFLGGRDVDIAQKDLDRLMAQKAQQDRQRQTSQQTQASNEVKAIVDALTPAEVQIKKIEDEAAKVKANLSKIPFDEQGAARNAMNGLLAQAKQLREDMAAGGASFADAVRNAQFGAKTVGYSPNALSAAQIEKDAQDKALDVVRQGGSQDEQFKRLQSIEMERVTKLQTLTDTLTRSNNTAGGAFSRAPESVQKMITDASRATGLSESLIAALGQVENGMNLTGATKVLKKDGTPATSAYGFGQITDGAEKDIRRVIPGFDKTNPSTAVQGAAEYLKMRIQRAGGNEDLGIMGYFGAQNPDGTPDMAARRAYLAKIRRAQGESGDPSVAAQSKAQDDTTRAARDANEELERQRQNYGQNTVALEASARAQQQYNSLLDAGMAPNEELRKTLLGLATAAATASQKVKLIQFAQDQSFARDQLGRSDSEQAIYGNVRSTFGDVNSDDAKAAIRIATINDNLKTTKDLSKEAFTGLATDISHGVSAMDALHNAFTRLADKLISMAADQAISGLFKNLMGGGGGGGGGGFLQSLFGGGGGTGSGGSSVVTGSDLQAWPTFATGGYTGAGGKYQPAGIVHAGEYVFDAASTARIGVAALSSLRGYADGGYVTPSMPAIPAMPANANQAPVVNVTNNAAGDGYEVSATTGKDGSVMLLVDKMDGALAKKVRTGRSALGAVSGAKAGLRG